MRWSSKYVTFGDVFFATSPFLKSFMLMPVFSRSEFKMEAGDDDSWKESPLWRVHVQLPGFTPGLVESISSFTLPLRDTNKWRVCPWKMVATKKKNDPNPASFWGSKAYFRGQTTHFRVARIHPKRKEFEGKMWSFFWGKMGAAEREKILLWTSNFVMARSNGGQRSHTIVKIWFQALLAV